MIRIDTRKLVGLDEIRASQMIAAAGGYVNVTVRDGIPVVENTDFRTDRVNLELRGDRVVKATVG